MKRPRARLLDESSEESEDEALQGRSQIDRSKRARISEGSHDDRISDDSSNDDIEEEQATQFRAQQSKRRKDDVAAENGIIESISCTNFMCHTYLEVTLGPLINFIIGHNGSGKSAVLTAITLCLGGRAISTNRGASLKSFIKQGQEYSTLCVKLKNQGETAYQPEIYGESILVERHFTKAGTSGFKLKSSSGRIISTRKADLEDICDYFTLQLDNPMSVLTQDMARQFLNHSNPSDKYKFFLKGTQLEQLGHDYDLITENLDKIEAGFSRFMHAIENLKREYRKAKELEALSKRHDTLRQKIKNFQNQMAWAQIEVQEQKLEEHEADLRNSDELMLSIQNDIANAAESFQEVDGLHDHANVKVEDARTELEPLQSEKEISRQNHMKAKADLQESRMEQRTIREHLRASDQRIKTAHEGIKDEYRRLEAANGGNHLQRLQEINDAKAAVDECRTLATEHNNNLRHLEEDKRSAERAIKEFLPALRRKENEINEGEERLDNMMRDRGQQLRGYQPNMSQLIKAVAQDNGFQNKPVGPIGNHIRLLQPIWSSILEKSLGGALNSFVVTSKLDQTRLSALMQRIRCPCPILIGNTAAFDISSHEPDPSYLTALKILEIDNDLVTRQLIINQGIEQTILIESMPEAIETMDNGRLRNVKQCFSINDSMRGAGIRLTYGWGGTLSSTYVEPYRGQSRMKTDIEFQINEQRKLVQDLKNQRRDLENRHRGLQTALKHCQEAIVRHQRSSRDHRVETQRAEDKVDVLQDALDREAVEEGRLDALKEGLLEAEQEKEVQENSYGEAVLAIDRLTEVLRTCAECLERHDAGISGVQAKIRAAESKALKLYNQRMAALQKKNKDIQHLEDETRRREELENDRADQYAVVEQWTAKAIQVSPRVSVDPGETTDTLEQKLQRLVTDLEQHESRIGGDPRTIAAAAKNAEVAMKAAEEKFKSEERLAQTLKHSVFNRQDRLKLFRNHISARARLQFNYLLSERGFRGKLTIAHKQRMLDLDVQPDETQDGIGRKTKTLSGGEKSFSTICLLLSLWEAMGAPIRCLDEFDVFMDSVNRDVSLKMMITAAARSVQKQYILITPQAMGSVSVNDSVRIIKLSDPERGQTTINF